MIRKLTCITILAGACSAEQITDRPDGGAIAPDTGELFDDLSMPAEPTLELAAFMGSAACGECHTRHFAEWRTSMHAHAMVDPIYRALVKVRQADFGGLQDRFCTQCHSAIGTRGGDIQRNFSFEALSPISLDGVTCEACHRVSGLSRAYNSGHQLDPDGPIRGPFADPVATGFHISERSELLERSEFCGGCHDVIEVAGVNIERPYAEWLESPSAGLGQTCQDCHMPTDTGTTAIGGPERTLHSHRFVGVDVPVAEVFRGAPGELDDIRNRVRALLEGSGSLEVATSTVVRVGRQLDLFVTVTNEIAGHNLPTGTTSNRQLWLELIVTDGSGDIIYQTGHVDANGDLRDHWSELDQYGDDDLITFHSGFVDPEGVPVLFPWRAAEHISASLSPGYTRTHTLFVPTASGVTGPLSVQSRLLFRPYPPHLLRALGFAALAAAVPTYEIATSSVTVGVIP